MPDHVSCKVQFILHGKFQIPLICITNPIPTDLNQLPWDTYLESPGGTPSPKRMSSEIRGILQASGFEDVAKSVNEDGTCEDFVEVLVRENKGWTILIRVYI